MMLVSIYHMILTGEEFQPTDHESLMSPKSILPTKLSQLCSTTEITPELLRKVADSTNIINSNPRALDADEIYDILMECR